jgi:hypothetical protein
MDQAAAEVAEKHALELQRISQDRAKAQVSLFADAGSSRIRPHLLMGLNGLQFTNITQVVVI